MTTLSTRSVCHHPCPNLLHSSPPYKHYPQPSAPPRRLLQEEVEDDEVDEVDEVDAHFI